MSAKPAALAVLLSITASPLSAQDTTSRVDHVLEQVLLEGHVIMKCMLREKGINRTDMITWDDRVSQVLRILARANYDENKLSAFRMAADIAALMPGPDTPAIEIDRFCEASSEVFQTLEQRYLVRLPDDLEEALAL